MTDCFGVFSVSNEKTKMNTGTLFDFGKGLLFLQKDSPEMRWKQHNVNRNEEYFVRREPSRLHNAFKRKIAATDTNFMAPTIIFKGLLYAAPMTWFEPTEKLFKKVGKLGDGNNTKGIAIPVNIDLKEDKQQITPPLELVKEAIRKSSYRVIMNECACRHIDKCEHYPRDLGCMFLGPGAKPIAEHKSGHEATVEECIEHVERAIAAGLSVGTYFVELEEYCWGFMDEDVPDFIAFCFCCPCCCHEIKFEKVARGELKHLLYQSSGWSVVPDLEKCIGCGECVPNCPRDQLSVVNGKITVDEFCPGCGFCLNACKQDVLHIVKTGETKENLYDYFEKTGGQW